MSYAGELTTSQLLRGMAMLLRKSIAGSRKWRLHPYDRDNDLWNIVRVDNGSMVGLPPVFRRPMRRAEAVEKLIYLERT